MMETHRYGPLDSQEADLYLPSASRPPVVCLLHGGFWRMPYARDETAPIAADLAARGYAVWNIEYRRVGAAGGGWPGTLHDVAQAIDHLATLADRGLALNLDRVCVAGHSAGGHLALWSCSRSKGHLEVRGPSRVLPIAVAGLAAVVDLVSRHALSTGINPVDEFMGGTPEQVLDRYAAASPLSLLPLGVKQLILHGTADDALPVELTRQYVLAAQRAGDAIEYVELEGGGHMEFLDPASKAHHALCRWLEIQLAPNQH